jgi:hypothetical protein
VKLVGRSGRCAGDGDGERQCSPYCAESSFLFYSEFCHRLIFYGLFDVSYCFVGFAGPRLFILDADLQPCTTGLCLPKFHDFREHCFKGLERGRLRKRDCGIVKMTPVSATMRGQEFYYARPDKGVG